MSETKEYYSKQMETGSLHISEDVVCAIDALSYANRGFLTSGLQKSHVNLVCHKSLHRARWFHRLIQTPTS